MTPIDAAPADLIFDATEADFRQSVLERSLQTPVLLDCWAPWCGPCRSLTPVLEKVVQSYGGQVLLAKINVDEAPQIAAALQARSIPLVVLFVGGRPVDQFTGAQPESQIRAFLERHLSTTSPAEALRQEAAEAADPAQAEALLIEALEHEPGHVEVRLDLVSRLIDRGAFDDAAGLLESVPAPDRNDRHAALLRRIELASNRPPGDPAALAARIAANPKDFDARFELGALLAFEGDFAAAFEQLLEVVLRDKGEQRERARKQLVDWFDVCTEPDVVSRGRRMLGMYLN